MFNYIKRPLLLIIVLAVILFSGCANSYFVNSRIDDVLQQNSSSDEAIQWLIYNKELVAPVLADKLSSNNKNKVEEIQDLLSIMGREGYAIVLSNFQSLNADGKTSLAESLAAQQSKDAILQLLAMSSLEGGFEVSVQALTQMGDTSIEFLETLLYQEKYYNCVNAVLANSSERVIKNIIPLINSNDAYIQNRAMEIIALSKSDVIEPLISHVLADSSLTNEKAIRISTIALVNNKDAAIDGIISTVALGNADPITSATMLYELSRGNDLGIIFEKCARSSDALKTNDMLREIVRQTGVSKVIETAIKNPSNEILTTISFALASYEYSADTFVEVLNTVVYTDTSESFVYMLADRLIYDTAFKGVAKAIISVDPESLNAALRLDGANPKTIGEALSRTSDNVNLAERLNTLLNNMDSQNASSTLIMLAYGEDAAYPKLVWDRYVDTDTAMSQKAMDVILEATSVGIKFKYTDMDFLPYADKLLDDLNSYNSDTKNKAMQILNKIPEGIEHHDFYEKIYSEDKDQSIFTILSWHYTGSGSLKLNLSVVGTDSVVNDISYSIKSIKVSKIDSEDFIDYEGMIKQSINTLGLNIVNDANTELVISISETPLYKHYYGLVGNSYLGAKCTTTIDIYIGGQKVKTVSGYYEILPPNESPVGTSVAEYKPDPEDAPLENPFIISYVDALYKAFGENVLFGIYHYDRYAVLEVGAEIWNEN